MTDIERAIHVLLAHLHLALAGVRPPRIEDAALASDLASWYEQSVLRIEPVMHLENES